MKRGLRVKRGLKRGLCLAVCLLLLLPCASAQARELSDWSLRELILQKIMVSVRQWSDTDPENELARAALPGLTQMNDSVRDFFSSYRPGGVILFKQNTQRTDEICRLIDDMQSTVVSAGAPAMLVALDQEGGRITRLVQGTSTAGNMALGATGSADYARESGRIIGSELKALGFNMDCAPSLDVNCNPLNPVINLRAFGEAPRSVAELGVAFARGLEDEGVISVVKHFPGHGDTQTDSHSALPLVEKSRAEIDETELAPFRAAIEAGVQVVMSAHIQYPALDDTKAVSASTGEEIRLPATLSKKILTDLLRGELGFEGVVMTDAMNMDAIAVHFGTGEALVRAFEAGVDIALMPLEIMCPGDVAAFEAAVCEVEAAVADGRLSRAALEASVRRILDLKARNGISGRPQIDADAAAAIVASPAHRALEREIADAAVTLIRDEGVLPLRLNAGDTLLLAAAYENELTGMRFGVERLIAEGKLPEIELLTYAYTKCAALDETLTAYLDRADAVIFDSEIAAPALLAEGNWQSDRPLELVEALNARGLPYCAVSVYLPQDLALLSEARALVAVYNGAGMSDEAYRDARYAYGPNLPAAMDVIFGAVQPGGTLPVTVYELDENRAVDTARVRYPLGFSARK